MLYSCGGCGLDCGGSHYVEWGHKARHWDVSFSVAFEVGRCRGLARLYVGPRANRLDSCIVLGREVRERSEEHTSELQSRVDLVCRLLLEKKKKPWREYFNRHTHGCRAHRRRY